MTTAEYYAHAKKEANRKEDAWCVRHVNRRRNPKSKSYCDDCLEYYRKRYTPIGGTGGRPRL